MTRLRSVSEIMPALNDEICLKHGIILFPRHIETEVPLQPDCTCLMREAATIVKKYFAQAIKKHLELSPFKIYSPQDFVGILKKCRSHVNHIFIKKLLITLLK